MNTNFNGSGTSQPDVNDPKYLPVIKSFVELLDEIIAQKNAINTHAISLSTLKKWSEKRIDLNMINQTEGPLDELRNSIALALQELALTVFNKHNGKNDHVIYAQLARQIEGLTPETLQLLENNQGMLDDVKASKPPLPIAAYVIIAVVLVGIYLAATKSNRQEEKAPNPELSDMPKSFTTVDGASVNTTGMAAETEKTDIANTVERTPMVKVINNMDKLAKIVIVGVEGHPVYSVFIEPKSQKVVRDMKFGAYTFRVATGSREALLSFSGKTRWQGTSFEDQPADTVVALETKKEFSRTTIWLEEHPTKGVVYNILEEMSPKPKQ
ncbi:hypothetical protein [Chitinophaga pinensis]|nr:hypothetical protein [Chitinophaga pinensis]